MSRGQREIALGRVVREVAEGLDGRLGLVVQVVRENEPVVALHVDASFVSASIIKLPILWSFLRAVDLGHLDAAERVAFDRSTVVAGTGILQYLNAGLRPTLLDFATLMIVVSDNTATNALIDRLGIARINDDLAGLGLTGTALRRRMFDFEARARGLENVTTPADMARLLDRFARGDGLSADSTAHARRILLGQQFHSALPGRLPYGTPWAHKTGNLPGVLHDAGWLEGDDGMQVVVAAFTNDLRNDGDGTQALARIGEAVAGWLVAGR